MAHIGVFCLQILSLACPREFIVIATRREAIVTDTDDLLVWIDNASAYLSVGILTALG
jgi:hypothetical protein